MSSINLNGHVPPSSLVWMISAVGIIAWTRWRCYNGENRTKATTTEHDQKQMTYITVEGDTERHLSGVIELARHTYGGHDWIVNEFPTWFTSPSGNTSLKNRCVVLGIECVETGELAGLFVMRPLPYDHIGCLEALRVHPSHRGRGLAHRLQREMIAEVRKRRMEGLLDVNKLWYNVYDENIASVKVALGSGMRITHTFPYLMVAEDEQNAENDFLGRVGPGALRQLLEECLHVLSSTEKSEGKVEALNSIGETLKVLRRHRADVLYQDWKPYLVSSENLEYLIQDKGHKAMVTPHGVSIGLIRPDNRGKICIVSHYSMDIVDDPAMDVLKHWAYWLRLSLHDGNDVKSFYCSYPSSAHPTLRKWGIIKREKPQLEYVLELDL